jgi:hypothetical protein
MLLKPRLTLLLVAVGTALLANACSVLAEASLLPSLTGPLATVTTRGGECFDGPCGDTFVIERDGRVHRTTHGVADLGQVPGDVLVALDAAIKTTDFDSIRAAPFGGECPTAFDGQEFIYEFGAPTGIEQIASCETRVDPSHPVFAALAAALIAVDLFAVP